MPAATAPTAASLPRRIARQVATWLALALTALVVLQVFFVLRIAVLAWWDPASTAVQRSQAWQLATSGKLGQWRHSWVPYEAISPHLKRAVIAAEDGRFFEHSGVEWDAIEKAWQKNEAARQAAEKAADKAAQKAAQTAAAQAKREATQARRRGDGAQGTAAPSPTPVTAAAPPSKPRPVAKVVGGSTITQQLAKNLLLSGERTLIRKAQELVLTWALEAMLDKRQILALYLNHVEWGEGVFGAEAAAQRYFGRRAQDLSAPQAARLAVMLPRPRHFEKSPQSAYLTGRSRTIQARMGAVELP